MFKSFEAELKQKSLNSVDIFSKTIISILEADSITHTFEKTLKSKSGDANLYSMLKVFYLHCWIPIPNLWVVFDERNKDFTILKNR